MDNDAISRSAAMNSLSKVFGIPLDYDGNCDEMCDETFAAIEALPALDVAPAVHARWVDGTTRIGLWIKCSSCGVEQTERDAYGYKHSFNFCPNCGARMDGEDNG